MNNVGIRSKAAIMGHPIHPMLVPFPIALISAALVADVVFWVGDDHGWADGAFWLLVGGLVTGLLAGVVGATDYLTIKEVRQIGTARLHALGNIVVVLLTLVNVLIRLGDHADGALPWGLVLSALSAALLAYTGWLGGELSYRHLVGVNPR